MEVYRTRYLDILVYIIGLYSLLLSNKCVNCDSGFFWHVTDMHWDPTYSQSKPGVSCGPGYGDGPALPVDQYGQFGDYRCDSPWTLITSSLRAMKSLQSDVDFLIWTGDDTPHNANLTLDDVATIISNLTDVILESFPTAQVYPVLGNHDWSPKHLLPPNPDPFYQRIADMWTMWLSPEAKASFLKAGYYSMPISVGKLLLVGLNSNLYYRNNAMTASTVDPGDQFQWLDNTLTNASRNGLKVILIGHVPPGQFEKHINTTWYRPPFNVVFIDLLRQHAGVIASAHFAHHHTDSFRLVNDNQGKALTSFLIAPAVTPWETTLPGIMGGAGNNPGIRLVEYDRDDGRILDLKQYFLNLTSANAYNNDNWQQAYGAKEYYSVTDVTTSSLESLANRLLTDDVTFDKYYKANGLFFPDNGWTHDFRNVHYCAVTQLDITEYSNCYERLSAADSNATSAFLGFEVKFFVYIYAFILTFYSIFA